MKPLSISNLAWDVTTETTEVFPWLQKYGFEGIEIAPTKLFPDFWEIFPSDDRLQDYAMKLADHGIKAVAMQSIIYGRGELQLFGDQKQDFLKALDRVFLLASKMGIKPLVFGSPKNRMKGNLSDLKAHEQAVDFFHKAADLAHGHGVCLCMEANPVEYGGDFVHTTPESLALVKAVDHPGFRLHLDAGGIHLAGDDVTTILEQDIAWVEHFHISNPFLKAFDQTPVDHATLGRLLSDSGYDRAVSIEMLPPENGVKGIENALSYVSKNYENTI